MDILQTQRIAEISKLSFGNEKLNEFSKDLQEMIQMVDKLSELDTENIEPLLYVTPGDNKLREDIITPSITQEQALKNAPQHDDLGYIVQRIL